MNFQRFFGLVFMPIGTRKKPLFFVALAGAIFAESAKTTFNRGPDRHRFGRLRSKNFEKSEKKACQPSKTPVILTAKPNQTIGETNDKKRTAHVWILPHSSRSCCRNSSRPRGKRLRANHTHAWPECAQRAGPVGSYHRARHRDRFVHPDRG